MAIVNNIPNFTEETTKMGLGIATKRPTTLKLTSKITKSTSTSTTMATTIKTEATTKKITPVKIATTNKVTSMKTEATTKKVTPMKTEATTKKISSITSTTMATTKKVTYATIPTNSTKNPTITMKTVATTISTNKVFPTEKKMITVDVLADPEDTFGTVPIETDYADEDSIDNTKTSNSNEHLKTTYPNVQFLSNKEKSSSGIFHEALLEIGISTAIGILFLLIVVLLVAKKYNFRCINFKRNNRRNNESMSDVRFLTNDEVLDFTWRTEE